MPEGREDTDDGDQALLAQAKRGGASAKTAYDALVRRHQAWLVRLLAQLLQRSPAEAEDIARKPSFAHLLQSNAFRKGPIFAHGFE